MLVRLGLRATLLGRAGRRKLSFYSAEHVDTPPNSGTVVGIVSLKCGTTQPSSTCGCRLSCTTAWQA